MFDTFGGDSPAIRLESIHHWGLHDMATKIDPEVMSDLGELILSGLIVPELRPDGQMGWRPAPLPCPLCGGEGFSLVVSQLIVCPYCKGTGIEETDVL